MEMEQPGKPRTKTTIVSLDSKKAKGIPVVGVTAYSYPEALLADAADVDLILVGDSLGMTVLGYKNTVAVTMEDMISHSRGVWRANKFAFQVGDMPFMSYQDSNKTAVKNAGRFIQEGGCDAIKLEGPSFKRIKAISDAGILVMAHLGLTPQARAALGGYRVQGKSNEDALRLRDDALRVQDAGARFLFLEAVPPETAAKVRESLEIPVYGIGAGADVDGQLVIFHDLVGMFFEFRSKFVKRYVEAGELILEGLSSYATEVRERKFPSPENFYKMPESELEAMLADPRWKYHTNPPLD
jgi:3-methyl-2-oxobutanoate hydroxymethyltransferase